jgi:2-polyprenyl-3-methyl-5-hydroxy-6-metoxy-1,4-benzoquinol methylase
MLAGMELDLFTPLEDGPLNAEQLAAKLAVNPGKLAPLCYSLVIAGLLTEDQGAFSNTPETAEYFVRGKSSYMGTVYKIWMSNLLASLQTAETIRSGVPQARYDWARMPEEELLVLYEGMAAPDVVFAKRLSEKFDFSACRSLLDAGCGSGTLAIALTKLHPQLTATVVDLPTVTPITAQFVEKENAAEKVTVVSADLTKDSIPGSYDVAIIGSVLQTISAEDARKVVLNVGKVVEPGGQLFLFGSGMLQNSRLAPRAAVEFNLVFINVYDEGQSYTESEYTSWLEAAGFEEMNFNYDEFRITARKKGKKPPPRSE